MEQPKQCMLCGQEIGKYTCSQCGMIVGDNCHDKETGLCTACKQGKKAKE